MSRVRVFGKMVGDHRKVALGGGYKSNDNINTEIHFATGKIDEQIVDVVRCAVFYEENDGSIGIQIHLPNSVPSSEKCGGVKIDINGQTFSVNGNGVWESVALEVLKQLPEVITQLERGNSSMKVITKTLDYLKRLRDHSL